MGSSPLYFCVRGWGASQPLYSLPLFRGPFEDGFRGPAEPACSVSLEPPLEPPRETHFPTPQSASGDVERQEESLGLAQARMAPPSVPFPPGRDQSRLLGERGNASPNSPTSE